jgi:protein arginine kinase activator
MPKKCQRCTRQATLHITEVLSKAQYEEHHFCEECAKKHLYTTPGAGSSAHAEEPGLKNCEHCGLKFSEFRSTGRFGCPHDYDHFQEELEPLLQSIHGLAQHVGKAPLQADTRRRELAQLAVLRLQLDRAIESELYEEAAELRDRIQQLESVRVV